MSRVEENEKDAGLGKKIGQLHTLLVSSEISLVIIYLFTCNLND